MYVHYMDIVWDEPKRQSNLSKHGLDFADLSYEFFLAANVASTKQGRLKAIGRLADGTIVVIFITLGTEALSIISMRTANKVERSKI